jgi:hypothetical protein
MTCGSVTVFWSETLQWLVTGGAGRPRHSCNSKYLYYSKDVYSATEVMSCLLCLLLTGIGTLFMSATHDLKACLTEYDELREAMRGEGCTARLALSACL